MKKIVLILLVLFVLGGTAAFAEHPDGLGIGVVSANNVRFGANSGYGFGLSLKAPGLPVFWGVNLELNSGYLGLGVVGDYYFIDDTFLSTEVFDLGWYLGLGGYGSIGLGNDITLALGARLPVGLSMMFNPIPLEIFLDIAPAIGLSVIPLQLHGFHLQAQGGIRIWL